MESVKALFAQRSTMQKTTKNLHERDSRAKKHRTQCLLCSRSGDFLSHCSGALEPAEMTPEGKYRRQQILSWRDTDLLVPTSRSTTACLFSPFSKVSAGNIRVSELIRQLLNHLQVHITHQFILPPFDILNAREQIQNTALLMER